MKYIKGDFAIMPNMGAALKLEAGAFKIYAALCKFADKNGECFPAIATIAEATGTSESNVKRQLKVLKESGFVAVEMRQRENGSSRSNCYSLLLGVEGGSGLNPYPSTAEPPLTKPLEQPVPKGTAAEAESPVKKEFYKVVKLYGLPVMNHKHIDGWCDKLRETLGEEKSCLFLVRLQERDLRREAETHPAEFVPTLNRPLDIIEKCQKIIRYYNRTMNSAVPAAEPRKTDAELEAERQKAVRG